MKKKVTALLLAGLFVLVGCTKTTDTTEPKPLTPTAPPAAVENPARARGATLAIALPRTEERIQPYDCTYVTQQTVNDLLYEGLLRIDDNGLVENVLARRYELIEEEERLVFYLKENIAFHDGSLLTAEDVADVYNAAKISQDSLVNRQFFDRLAEVEVLDASTVAFKVDDFSHYDMAQFAFPIYKYPDLALDFAAYHNSMPLGTGPYKVSAVQQTQWVFERFESYRLADYPVERITLYFENEAKRLQLLAEGAVDLAPLTPSLTNDMALRDTPFLKGVAYLTPFTVTVGMNHKHELFQSLDFRKALAYAIDKERFVSEFWPEGGEVAHGPVPSTHPYYPKTQASNVYKYNPVRASELLEEMGLHYDEETQRRYNGDEPIVLTLNAFNDVAWAYHLAYLIEENLEDIGIEVEVIQSDFETFKADVFEKRTSDFYIMGWQVPMLYPPELLFGKGAYYNAGDYASDAANALFDKLKQDSGRSVYSKDFVEWFKHANEELPVLFVANTGGLWGVNERVKGVEPTTYTTVVQQIRHWSLEADK